MSAFNAALNGANFAHPTLGYAPSSTPVPGLISYCGYSHLERGCLAAEFLLPQTAERAARLWTDVGLRRSWDPPTVETIIQDLGTPSSPRLVEPAVRDPNFWQRWIDRWQEVRKAITARKPLALDSLAGRCEKPRRAASPSGGSQAWRDQQGEINFLKNWLTNRLILRHQPAREAIFSASADSFTLDSI